MGTMLPDFREDVVFVTGAAGGMGRAISIAFAKAGARLVIADVDEAGGNRTAELAAGVGPAPIFVPVDVADEAQIAAAVGVAVERFGRLDCAVNAAAIENETVPLHECSADGFDRMHDVNTRGVFLSMKHEIAAMLANDGERRGAIVNIASTNAFRPQHEQPAYTASKHAVLGLTRSAALDYAARGIRINAICPGTIDTPMLRKAMERRGRDPQDVVSRLSLIGRFGTPDEIASATLFLCSDAASFVYGHPLAVDAGYLAR